MIKLTNGQAEGLANIAEFLKSDDPCYLLTGKPGTGKTFLLSEVPGLVKYGTVIGCGPTHKAVEVLATRLPEIECCTIHRFLGLRPKRTKDKTVLTRRNDYDPSSNMDVRVVLMDESSMNGTEITAYILEDIKTWGRQYIFVGDRHQLPPVNEVSSPCFNLDFGRWRTHLTEIVRQAADNPIIQAAGLIQDAIEAGKAPEITPGQSDTGVVQILSKQKWREKLAEYVLAPGGNDGYRILAYRNAVVREYNQLVRETLGLDLAVPFTVGESVVVNEAFCQNEEVIFNTGEEYTVTDMQPLTHMTYPTLTGWSVKLSANGIQIPQSVAVLDDDKCGTEYKRVTDALIEHGRKHNDWRGYYRLVETFCDIRPLYAMTCHKSQGSTFDNVFLDVGDVYTNRNKLEADYCLNVGMTRARFNVYVRM